VAFKNLHIDSRFGLKLCEAPCEDMTSHCNKSTGFNITI